MAFEPINMDAYRIVVEVLRFVQPFDVLQSTSTVHSVWAQASASRELWFDLIPPHTAVDEAHPRDVYRQKFTSSVFIVLKDKLLRHYVVSRRRKDLALSRRLEVHDFTSVVKVDSGTLFVCGNKSLKYNTLSVSIPTGKVKELETLTPHRVSMGVILLREKVYAFCGDLENFQKTNACTMFTVKAPSWHPISASIHPRSSFNPCLHAGRVYLIGGTNELTPCEVYSPTKNQFKALTALMWEGQTIAVAHGKDICVISANCALRWRVGTTPQKPVALAINLRYDSYSGYQPTIVDGQLYLLLRSQRWVVQMDLSSFAWMAAPYDGGQMRPRKVSVLTPPILAPPPEDY